MPAIGPDKSACQVVSSVLSMKCSLPWGLFVKPTMLCALFSVLLLTPRLSSKEVDDVRGSTAHCPPRNTLVILFIDEEIYVYCEFYGKKSNIQQIESTLVGHSMTSAAGFYLLQRRAELSQYIRTGYYYSWVKKIILTMFIMNVLGVIAFAWARKKDAVRHNLPIVIFFIPIVGFSISNELSNDGASSYRHICVAPNAGEFINNPSDYERLERVAGNGRDDGNIHDVFAIGKLNNIHDLSAYINIFSKCLADGNNLILLSNRPFNYEAIGCTAAEELIVRLRDTFPTTLRGSISGSHGVLWQGKAWLCLSVNSKMRWNQNFFADSYRTVSPHANDIYVSLAMRGASDRNIIALGVFMILAMSLITIKCYLQVKKVSLGITLGGCGLLTVVGLYIGTILIMPNRFETPSISVEREQILRELSLALSIFTGCFFVVVSVLL